MKISTPATTEFMFDGSNYRTKLDLTVEAAPAGVLCQLCATAIDQVEVERGENPGGRICEVEVAEIENTDGMFAIMDLTPEAADITTHINSNLLDPHKPVFICAHCVPRLDELLGN